MKRYRSLILIVLLGISMIGFSRNNNRNNNGRAGNYSNNGYRHNNNSRPGRNRGNHHSGNNSRPGWNNNNTGNSGKYCVEKKRNFNQCVRYENYKNGQLPSRPPKL
ncbi:MAG: hypothetical protein LBV03_01630 [Fusobacteriales bacterium]|nr:hypothetical protein [Fusobacteriales bacterium]